MTQILAWSPALGTGVEVIDNQHRRFVGILNDLVVNCVDEQDGSVVQRSIAALADGSASDFAREEALWETFLADPEVRSQRAAHRNFIQKMSHFQRSSRSEGELQAELLDVLTEWLTFHMLDADRTMAWTLLGVQDGLSVEQARNAAEQRKAREHGRLASIMMKLHQRLMSVSLRREREAYRRGLEKTRQQQQLLLRAEQIGKIGSWKLELDTGTLEWSPEIYRILGVEPDSRVTPEDFFAAVHPDDVKKVQEAWRAGLSGGLYEVQHRVQCGDGIRWVCSRADFHTDDDTGSRLAIGTMQDITESVLRERQERFEQRFRTLVARISARFLSAQGDNQFDQAVDQTLEELGVLFDADRCFLILIDPVGTTWSNTHEWCAAGIEAQKDNLQQIPLDATPWWLDQLRKNRPLQVSQISALPPEAGAERELLQTLEIQSLLCLPTRSETQELTGLVGFDSVRREKCWDEDHVRMLQVVADIVSSAQSRRTAARALAENREDLLRAQAVGRVGSWKYDIVNDRAEWSPETYRLFGVAPGTPLGMEDFLSYVQREDRHRLLALWEAPQPGVVREAEYRTASNHGQTWLRGNIEFVEWHNGQPTVALGTIQDITAEKDHQRQLKALAFTDALTGLPNQHGFEQELELRMEQAAQSQFETCLFQIDIDALGQINAAMDMQTGDQILRTIAQRLSTFAGQAGHVGRLGGDQFALAMHNCGGPDDITGQVEALQALISQPIRLDGDVMRISACIGSVHNRGGVITQAGVLLRMADQAIYQAKLGGKNQHVIFDLAQYLSDRSRQHRLADIRQALHEQQLRLHYQPKVNLLTGRLLGLEALLRWQHPERGLLGPGDIIPHIEDHPLMMEVGQWVIDTALNQLQAWQQGGLDTAVSVNVASSQLEHPEFVDRLTDRLKASPALKPGQLELEIVETGPMLNMPTAVDTFKQLKALGVLISLDDFGTGHSSLQTLSVLAPNIVKVDQSFVLEMLNDLAARSIVQAVLDFSGAFRLRVIAEGVETPEHGRTLLRLGCRYGQGYAVARPMPPEQVIDWLEHWRNQPPDWIGDNDDTMTH